MHHPEGRGQDIVIHVLRPHQADGIGEVLPDSGPHGLRRVSVGIDEILHPFGYPARVFPYPLLGPPLRGIPFLCLRVRINDDVAVPDKDLGPGRQLPHVFRVAAADKDDRNVHGFCRQGIVGLQGPPHVDDRLEIFPKETGDPLKLHRRGHIIHDRDDSLPFIERDVKTAPETSLPDEIVRKVRQAAFDLPAHKIAGLLTLISFTEDHGEVIGPEQDGQTVQFFIRGGPAHRRVHLLEQ